MEFGKGLMETLTSESGEIPRLMVMEFIHGKTGIDTKESGIIVSSMVKELIYLQMETFT
jgi:hypothetical protein